MEAMTAFVRDLGYAVRQLRARPGFAFAVVVTLALGIGLNSAVFSLVDALLLAPLPVRASEELVSVFSSDPGDVMASSPLSAADYNDLRDRCRSFSGIGAYTYTPMAMEVGEASSLALGVRATEGFFDVLGVRAAMGRLFDPGDEAPGGEVVLSHLAWQRRFGGDPAVLGRTFRLNGRLSTVVGVLPESFFGLTRGVAPEVWVAMKTEGPRDDDSRFLWVVGRLAPEATLQEARSELDAVGEALAAELPATHAERDFVALPTDAVRILPGIDATLATASLLVMGVVVLVLLVAGTNVANLLLARGFARRREIATRLALGARPATVARQLLTESLLLALAGGSLGLLIVLGTQVALTHLRLPLPIDVALGLAVDGRVLLFTLVASVLTAVAFGLLPALAAARLDLVEALRQSAALGLSPRRLGGALVIVQVAASLVLLLDAGLAARSLGNAHRVDLGLDPSEVAVATFAPQLQGRSREEAQLFYDRLLDEVRALPAVESAALASHLPLTVELRVDRVATGADAPAWPSVDMALVGPGYFETLRIELQSGRTFRDTDRAGAPRVAVVNRSLADRFYPGEEAVGRQLLVDGAEEPYEVIGVVADGKYRTLGEAARPFLYRSIDQDGGERRGVAGEVTTASQTLLVRARGRAAAVLPDLRRVARGLDPEIAFARLERLEDTLEIVLFLPRAAAGSFALFGLLALVLASLGVYSLMVYTVSWRTREIGIRKALGATRRQVVGFVVRRALTLVLCGVGGGLAVAFATTRMLSAVLYGVSPTDPPTVLVVTSLLLAVALAASFLPARRASGIRVASALRVD